LENAAEHYAVKKSSETSERASRLEKQDLNSIESQKYHRQDMIKRKSLNIADKTDDQRNDLV
jgi:hypothetical protein